MTFVPNEGNIKLLFTNPTGGIAKELSRQGERIVNYSRYYVGEQWPGGRGGPRPRPYKRSGTLQESIVASEPLVIGGELQVLVMADPVNERGSPYGIPLREDGYQFVDLQRLGI